MTGDKEGTSRPAHTRMYKSRIRRVLKSTELSAFNLAKDWPSPAPVQTWQGRARNNGDVIPTDERPIFYNQRRWLSALVQFIRRRRITTSQPHMRTQAWCHWSIARTAAVGLHLGIGAAFTAGLAARIGGAAPRGGVVSPVPLVTSSDGSTSSSGIGSNTRSSRFSRAAPPRRPIRRITLGVRTLEQTERGISFHSGLPIVRRRVLAGHLTRPWVTNDVASKIVRPARIRSRLECSPFKLGRPMGSAAETQVIAQSWNVRVGRSASTHPATLRIDHVSPKSSKIGRVSVPRAMQLDASHEYSAAAPGFVIVSESW